MDNHQRSKRKFNFWIKFIIRLGGFAVLYLSLVRPIQSLIVDEVMVPYLRSTLSENSDFLILANQDDYCIESRTDKFIDLFFNLPFNGYFCLAFFLIFNFGKKSAIKIVIYYNWALFMIHPILIFILLNQNYWIAPIINAHEMVYKALFLSLGVLAIKEGVQNKRGSKIRVR